MMKKINEIYQSRKNRESHPDGIFDNGDRWYPSTKERQNCCDFIRAPSRNYPYSLMSYCRTKKHIKNLVENQ